MSRRRRSRRVERREGSIRVGGAHHVPELLDGPGLLVAHGLGGDAPLRGDLGGGLALEGGLDQGRLARAERLVDRLLEVPPGDPTRASSGFVKRTAATVSSGWKLRSRWAAS